MSAHGMNRDYKLAAEFTSLPDPGDAGTITTEPEKGLTFLHLVSAGAETRTLADPPAVAGLRLFIEMYTDGGDITLTASSAIEKNGNTVLVFTDRGDWVELISVRDGADTYAWHVVKASVGSKVVNVGDVAAYTVLARNSGKPHTIPNLTADLTITLPSAAAGLEYEFIYAGVAADAQDWLIDTGADANFFLGGLVHLDADAGSAGDEVVPIAGDGNSNSKLSVLVPDVGTRVRLLCDGTNWILTGSVVAATVPSFADQ